jgi:hypothetical protein
VQFNYSGVGHSSGARPKAAHPLHAEPEEPHWMAADVGLSQGGLVSHISHFAE